MKTSTSTLVALAALILSSLPGTAYDEDRPSSVTTPPDFTKGGEPAGKKDHVLGWKHWNLGPTGAYGWIWAHPKTISSDGATQVYVIKVDPDTPAAGKLEAGDVILGAAGGSKAKPFIKNARRELAAAITEAETTEQGGKLSLLIWRDGKTLPATLQLPVMGSYSSTSPAQCKKTHTIVDLTAARLAREGLDGGSIPNLLNALGLLATGDEMYLPLIREYAHKIGDPDKPVNPRGMVGWSWAYTMMFLAEYYLVTDDEFVLPALEQYAATTARGRSGVGTWGHSLVDPASNGGNLYGPVGGYGAMNATGIPLTIGLVLARKCGIQNKEIDTAIKKSADFLRYFADKGGIPYGDHAPWLKYYCNNGKNAEAAVLFDLLGDTETASFFTAMTLASVQEREEGHTGPYFSMVWGALGAARGGREAGARFMREMRWYDELQRRPGGDFRYQPVMMGGEEHGKYKNWSCAGVALLHHCLPRQAICLTGKGVPLARPMTADEVQACLDVAQRGNVYQDFTTEALLKLLEHRLPTTRRRAAAELAQREDNVVARLTDLLDSPNRYARYGACEGLRYAGRDSVEAAEALIAKGFGSEDQTLRYYAALAFAQPRGGQGLTSAALRAVPSLLTLAAADDPEDPHRKLQATIAGVLFYPGGAQGFTGIFPKGRGLETVDRSLLIPAIKSLLTNPNGGARSTVANIYPVLSEQDLQQLWGDIYLATKNFAPSGVMFGKGVQDNGLRLLSKHHYKEGMTLAAFHLMQDKHGKGRRVPFFMDVLVSYGAAAKPLASELKAERLSSIAQWGGMSRDQKKEYVAMLEQKFAKIENAKEAPKLKDLTRYLK